MPETSKNENGGSKWFRLGPVEYAALGFVVIVAGTFLTNLMRKVEDVSTALATQLPLLLEKQTVQGKDIDGLKGDVRDLTKEITNIRLREAQQLGRDSLSGKP